MPESSYPTLLAQRLRAVPRRYQVPALPAGDASLDEAAANPAGTLAVVIEQARAALAAGVTPAAELGQVFVEALAHLIRQALKTDGSDLAFQAMVLRHRAARVREYASLANQAVQDGRQIRGLVNAMAHPAKQARADAIWEREAMVALHAAMATEDWPELLTLSERLVTLVPSPTDPAPSDAAASPPLEAGLRKLLDDPALSRLIRLKALLSDDEVQQYRSLWDRHGPRSGSPAATAQGEASRQRGAASEAQAAQALEQLARCLNTADTDATVRPAPYRVVTAMHVPGSLAGNTEGAKTEWDTVLLRRAGTDDDAPIWDIALLVEVKASADAATTDFPRLLRGLRLLATAQDGVAYAFPTRQGVMSLRGSSLHALPTEEAHLGDTVLYASDSPHDPPTRPLGAASRMQLLTAPASLDYASDVDQGRTADSRQLEPLWQELLDSPNWQAVLQQYATLRRVRERMVHVADLAATLEARFDEEGQPRPALPN